MSRPYRFRPRSFGPPWREPQSKWEWRFVIWGTILLGGVPIAWLVATFAYAYVWGFAEIVRGLLR